MDILKILQESVKDLYPEDLDFFETELATGNGYDNAYRDQCLGIIKTIRQWMSGETVDNNNHYGDEPYDSIYEPNVSDPPKGLVVDIGKIAPKEANTVWASMTPEQLIYQDISSIRKDTSYKTQFKKYVSEKDEIDAEFVDKHYSFFQPWELDAIVSVKQMGEEFNEKYFGAIDHDKIARYQQFSEAFFIKHFSQMDASIVLEHGKNEWRKKENRSKQLDVFLRLKGIKI